MNFVNYQSKATATFKQTVTMAAFAAAVKAQTNSASINISNVLGTDEKKYCIVTLADGRSCTLPVSKKATVGQPVRDLYAAESTDGQWVICTSAAHEGTTF